MTGCYIYIFRQKSKLIRVIKKGLPTFFKFDVEEDGSQKYIGILNENHNNWKELLIKNSYKMQLDKKSMFYKAIKD